MKLEERNLCKYSGIYKITNKKNGHSYIGQAKNIDRRIYFHLLSTITETRSDYNYPLHIAIRKYGLDAFELDILEKCSIKDLNSKEQYWIKFYHTYKQDPEYSGGYNLTAGGKQSIRHIKLTEAEAIKIKTLLLETSLTTQEIADSFKITRDYVNRINVGDAWYQSTFDYPIRKTPVVDLKKLYGFNGTCILQIDKITNEVLNRFPSRNMAAIWLGSVKYGSHISQAISGKRQSAWGYKWAKEEISEEAWIDLLNNFIKEA